MRNFMIRTKALNTDDFLIENKEKSGKNKGFAANFHGRISPVKK